jgi:hypothetical protein
VQIAPYPAPQNGVAELIDMRNMFLACVIIKSDMNGINVFHALFCSLPITGRGHYFSVRSLSNKRFRER